MKAIKLTKRHKLYFRTKGEQIRRLDKASPTLYMMIIQGFLQGDWESQYQEMNKEVTHWHKLQPLVVPLTDDLSKSELDKLTKGNSLEVSYNSTWRPLVQFVRKGLVNDIMSRT